MARLKSFAGYFAAALSGLVMLATLPALIFLTEPFCQLCRPHINHRRAELANIRVSGLTVSAKYTGGQVAQTIDHGAYQTRVHTPAFEALIGESKEGFIQVDWAPLDRLPPRIDEETDADGDGRADLRLEVDTISKSSTLTPYAPWVLDLEGTFKLKDALMVRVRLRNPS